MQQSDKDSPEWNKACLQAQPYIWLQLLYRVRFFSATLPHTLQVNNANLSSGELSLTSTWFLFRGNVFLVVHVVLVWIQLYSQINKFLFHRLFSSRSDECRALSVKNHCYRSLSAVADIDVIHFLCIVTCFSRSLSFYLTNSYQCKI